MLGERNIRVMRRGFGGALLAAFSLIVGARAQGRQEPGGHRLVMHVNRNDAGEMNGALDSLQNVADFYAGQHQPVQIELVANGPAYAMLRDTSPVAARISEIHRQYPAVVFSACQNSRRGIARREGKQPNEIIELPEATDVPAGIIRIMELQDQGWPYYKV